jgi:hypothetical protein
MSDRKRMDIDHLQPGFTSLLLKRVNPEKNENRFYYLAWQPSLFEEWRWYAVCHHHRKLLR